MVHADDRIAALERSVAALATQLTEVQQQLAHARIGGFRSIRDSRRCPACGSGALLHVRRAKVISYGRGGTVDFSIAHEHSAIWGTTKPKGGLECFACRTCGLAEWHVLDLEDIPIDGENIVAIEPEPDAPSSGPFR